MGFISSIASFLADPIVGTVANVATGLLGQKGANDRNEQQMAMTREQMAWQEGCRILLISGKLLI